MSCFDSLSLYFIFELKFQSGIFALCQRHVRNGSGRAQTIRSISHRLLVTATGRPRQSASTPDRGQKRRQRSELPKCKYMCTLSKASRVLVGRHLKEAALYRMSRKRILPKLNLELTKQPPNQQKKY